MTNISILPTNIAINYSSHRVISVQNSIPKVGRKLNTKEFIVRLRSITEVSLITLRNQIKIKAMCSRSV